MDRLSPIRPRAYRKEERSFPFNSSFNFTRRAPSSGKNVLPVNLMANGRRNLPTFDFYNVNRTPKKIPAGNACASPAGILRGSRNRPQMLHAASPCSGITPCQVEAALDAIFRIASPRSREVEAIQVHHLAPGRHEVTHEHLLRVRARIKLRKSPKLRVRTED